MTKKSPSSDLFANLTSPKNPIADAIQEEMDKDIVETSDEDAGFEPEPEEEIDPIALQAEEYGLLVGRAKIMGIKLPDGIGLNDLRELIRNTLNGTNAPVVEPTVKTVEQVKAAPSGSIRGKMMREQLRLIRVRITNLDPNDKDLHGNIYTVANEYLGAVRKYVPFGEATDNGYHIPYILYKALKDMVFTQYKTVKDARGREQMTARQVRKFAMEILPPLTTAEIAQIAAQQAAAGGLDTE